MGRGIAYLAALAGYETTLYDVTDHIVHDAMTLLQGTFSKAVEKKKLDPAEAHKSISRIVATSDFEAAVREADLIVEAVPEDLSLKRELYAQIDVLTRDHVILASNTSSISISELAASVEEPEVFIGMHFFNPPHLMKLVEIVVGDATSEATVSAVRDVATRMGKETIVVKDFPGFATSRLGVAIGLEAIRMFEDGVASAVDIDKAMELGYNHPMGPLRLTDLVGLDVRLGIAEYLAKTLGPRFDPPRVLREMVANGQLGKKTGKGFYEWEP
ncbi:MAG: 3-hydroxyacyl-CoA dehydrogenase family protein [Acidobacteria bacterium]|nr:3-hydroxyacyl-CoA dehydrogenase family protein [Acidobacteriota bacterium]